MLSELRRDKHCLIWRNNIMGVRPSGRSNKLYRAGLPKGSSDWIGLYAGVFLAIETKYRSKPTAMQRAFLDAVDRAGGIALVCDETNVSTILESVRAAWALKVSSLVTSITGADRKVDAAST